MIYQGRIKKMLTFSGYLDSATYYQIYPDTATVTASCPLKLLQNLYFDPGLYATIELFKEFDWWWDPRHGVLTSSEPLWGNLDVKGGLGTMIRVLLERLALWNPSQIHIQNLPGGFLDGLASKYEEVSEREWKIFQDLAEVIEKLTEAKQEGAVTPGELGGLPGSPGVSMTIPDYAGGPNLTPEQLAAAIINAGFPTTASGTATHSPAVIAWAIAKAENVAFDVNLKYINEGGSAPGSADRGIFQINSFWHNEVTDACAFDPVCNILAAYKISNGGKDWTQWATWDNGRYVQYLDEAKKYIQKALKDEETRTTTTQRPPDQDQDDQNQPDQPYGILGIATSQNGKKEEPLGSNRGPEVNAYLSAAGIPPDWGAADDRPWCAAFVTWVFKKAGWTPPFSNPALVNNWYVWAQNPASKSFVTSTPQPGDLVLFNQNTGSPEDDHIGFVVSVNGDNLVTIEGNSGHQVRYVDRTITSAVTFVRIPGIPVGEVWGGAPVPPDSIPGGSGEVDGVTPGAGGYVGASLNLIRDTALQAGFFSTDFKTNDMMLSHWLAGRVGMANDIPVFDWIRQASEASGRSFMSLPDGSLYFFYPDPFGMHGTQGHPYWVITPIEILDFSVQLTDREVLTHVFANFPHTPWSEGGISNFDRMLPLVASIMEEAIDVFLKTDQTGVTFHKEEFLQKYGARIEVLDLPNINHPFLAWFACWTRFLEQWSKQFDCLATFTYMPELYPGGRVEFRDLKKRRLVIMYIEQVQHSFDRASGFRTSAVLTSPQSADLKTIDPFALAGGSIPTIPPDLEEYLPEPGNVDDVSDPPDFPDIDWPW